MGTFQSHALCTNRTLFIFGRSRRIHGATATRVAAGATGFSAHFLLAARSPSRSAVAPLVELVIEGFLAFLVERIPIFVELAVLAFAPSVIMRVVLAVLAAW